MTTKNKTTSLPRHGKGTGICINCDKQFKLKRHFHKKSKLIKGICSECNKKFANPELVSPKKVKQ